MSVRTALVEVLMPIHKGLTDTLLLVPNMLR